MISNYIPIPPQLLPCLAIPLVELFPNLCLSWFTPPSLDLQRYKKLWYLRISLQSIAWYPLFEMLLPICPDYLPLFVIGTIVAVASRNFLMKKEIERVEKISLWNTLPSDKRKALFIVATKNRPSDINNFDEYVTRYVHHPTKLAGLIAYGIGNVIHTHLRDDEKYYIMLALTMFIIGGIGINGTRHGGSIMLDCIFRLVFGTAFIAILHYLGEASDIVMIKSI